MGERECSYMGVASRVEWPPLSDRKLWVTEPSTKNIMAWPPTSTTTLWLAYGKCVITYCQKRETKVLCCSFKNNNLWKNSHKVIWLKLINQTRYSLLKAGVFSPGRIEIRKMLQWQEMIKGLRSLMNKALTLSNCMSDSGILIERFSLPFLLCRGMWMAGRSMEDGFRVYINEGIKVLAAYSWRL